MDSSLSPPTVTFQLVPADIVALRRYLNSRTSSLILLLVPLIVLVAGLTVGFLSTRPRPLAAGGAGPNVASILALLIPIALFLVSLFAASRTGFGINTKTPILQHLSEVALLPEAFSVSVDATTTDTLWRGIMSIEATPTHLFVLTLPQSGSIPQDGFIVPRRAFDSDEAFAAFADYARQRWSEAQPETPPIAQV